MAHLNVGLIGCGAIAESAHAPALRRLTSLVRVRIVCDVRAEAAQRVAQMLDCAHALHDWQPDPADAIVAAFAAWLRGGPRPHGSIRADLAALALCEQILQAARASSALTTKEG